jgi:hypothetical protein
MANENLENLVKIRQLKAEPASKEEIAGLLRSGAARLEDSKNKDLNMESRFDLAYNAAHALSLAALRAAGYRSENRYLVFQCAQHTLNIEPEQWRVLDQAHRKRNLGEYEGDIDVDDELLEALIRVADLIAGKLREINDDQ